MPALPSGPKAIHATPSLALQVLPHVTLELFGPSSPSSIATVPVVEACLRRVDEGPRRTICHYQIRAHLLMCRHSDVVPPRVVRRLAQ